MKRLKKFFNDWFLFYFILNGLFYRYVEGIFDEGQKFFAIFLTLVYYIVMNPIVLIVVCFLINTYIEIDIYLDRKKEEKNDNF